jgi:hypothetical protein
MTNTDLRFVCLALATLIACALPRQGAAVIVIQDTSVFGTLSIPSGETGELGGTVTLEGATIEVFGTLLSKTDDITLTGSGQVLLNQPTGRWTYATLADSLLIDSGVEVLGQRGTSFATADTTNRGTFAAVPGGTNTNGFRIFVVHGFTNEGVLEARDGGLLWLDTISSPQTFNTTGTIRALPGGVVRFTGLSISSLATLGNIDNQGTIELQGILNNTAGTNFTGGDWALVSGAQVNGGMLTTSSGGRLRVTPLRSGIIVDPTPVEINGVTLATDLFVDSGARINFLGATTLNSTIRFIAGSGELRFVSSGSVAGTGMIQTDGGAGALRAVGGTVVLPSSLTLRALNNSLSLGRLTGDTLGAFDIGGPVEIEGGNLSVSAPTISRGSIVARNGGKLTTVAPYTLTNHGSIQIQTGSVLDLGGPIVNQGTITVDHAAIVLRSGTVTGPGSFSVADSTVLAGQSMTLAQLLSINGTRVDRGVYAGTLNLQGNTINIGNAPGQRWTLSGGSITAGTVNSSSGGELLVAPPPAAVAGNAIGTIYDLVLNADVRVPDGADLAITGMVTGTGDLIVDGGRLVLGNRDVPLPSQLVDRITPLSGEVVFAGPIDNVGRTITLRSGVEWSIEHVRSDVFIGGRVQGEPGVVLKVASGYGVAPWYTMRQGVTLALPTLIENTGMYVREGLNLDDATITIGQPNGSPFAHGRLVFVGPQTLGGEGEIRFNRIDGFPSNPLFPRINMIEIAPDSMQAAGLTIAPGITVRTSEGSGYIGGRYFHQLPPEPVPLTNRGTLVAENGHTLSLFVSDFAQRGTLRAATNSTLVVNDAVGENEGLLALDSGKITLVGQSYENAIAGEIRGRGTLDVSQTAFTNRGLIAPDGTLNVLGDFTQAGIGLLQLDVTSDAAATSDRLAIAGAAALAGSLALNHVGAAPPGIGNTWTLLTATEGVTGAFAVSAPWLPSNLALRLEHPMNMVKATLVERIAGDFNADGAVNAADYVVWRKTDGTTTGYNTWRTNFARMAPAPPGPSGATGSASAIPEPATLVILIAMFVMPVRWRISSAGTR